MTGLILKLAPNERVLINGAVIENGDRRTRLAICTPRANILRLKDAIHPDQATTPVSRACYTCQLILSGDLDIADGKHRLNIAVEELSRVFTDADSRRRINLASAAVLDGNAYAALKELRQLLAREARLFAFKQ